MASYSSQPRYANQYAIDEAGGGADRVPADAPDRVSAALDSTWPGTGRRDVIFTFAFTSWSGAAARGFCFSEDRLASALLEHPHVRRVLICDPFRSAPRKLVRALLGHRDTAFPTSDIATQHSPLRLKRDDPAGIKGIERAYAAYERGIRHAALRIGLDRPAIVTANPMLAGFGDFAWAGPVTFYAWDDLAEHAPRRRWREANLEAYRRIHAKRRRVVAVTPGIIDRIAPTGPNAVIPNAVNEEEWLRPGEPPAWFAALPSPRLLYLGSLESRIDVAQVRGLAAAFPGGSIVLVGPLLEPGHFEALRALPNVHFHPQVPRTVVPGLIGHADVGLVPHVHSELTERMSPLKLYEYLAGGLPVAAVDLPARRGSATV